MLAFLPLVRLAKITALIADIWTIVYIALVGIWHLEGYLKTGKWPDLPLSYFIFKPEHEPDGVDIAESVGADHLNTLLQVPVILVLIWAAALLTVFYLWLRKIERRYSGN